MMKKISEKAILGSVIALLLLVAIGVENFYFSDFEYRYRTKRFNRILSEKEKLTDYCLTSLKNMVERGEEISDVSKSELFNVIESEGITILY